MYPPVNVSSHIVKKIVDYTVELALALRIKGLINIQFLEYKEKLYVIEVNPRSSRTVPFISKVTGIPLIELAVRAIMGQKIRDMGYGTGLISPGKIVAAKAGILLDKLPMLEVALGPEMKSTGEVLGMAYNLSEAL